VGDFTVVSAESVGPAVGNELKGQAVRAVAWSLLGILLYVALRFEFRFSLGAVAATVHDVIITIGFLAVLKEPFDISVIAAVLTVVGFSLNDTIVVFDRIRETMRESRGIPFMEVIDRSINETLSRTMLTSGLTMLTVLALLIWGGPVLRGFSLALAIGVVVGTYSSIFVASPIVLMMERGRRRRVRAEARSS
jgi:preprotein translocase subunit SecF